MVRFSKVKKILSSNWAILGAVLLGLGTSFIGYAPLDQTAHFISSIMVKALQLISLPILFLSIVSTLSGMNGLQETKRLGLKVLKYTLLTTIAAATIALLIFLFVHPNGSSLIHSGVDASKPGLSYLDSIVSVFPSNVAQVFASNNVFGIVLIALGLGLAVLSLPKAKKEPLHQLFDALFSAMIKVIECIIRFLPIGIWAFAAELSTNLRAEGNVSFKTLLVYAACVVGANLVQGMLVLPLFLKLKGISPMKSFKGMLPAVSVAFFSKSSNAALPFSIRSAEENLGVSKKMSGFSFPLCSTINMNGCAAFILITTLFVASSYGIHFSAIDYVLWILLSTFAAIGNAGVPMGCYFLSSAILAGMGVPLEILGLILPLYAVIDMIETALNVWSDSCVTLAVDLDEKSRAPLPVDTL